MKDVQHSVELSGTNFLNLEITQAWLSRTNLRVFVVRLRPKCSLVWKNPGKDLNGKMIIWFPRSAQTFQLSISATSNKLSQGGTFEGFYWGLQNKWLRVETPSWRHSEEKLVCNRRSCDEKMVLSFILPHFFLSGGETSFYEEFLQDSTV